ncbi:MAG: hypothetical protein M1570_02445 [Chloroflexi bacterium]|nr:hypothetical protein [Chloroflexota bacterium]
MRRHRSRPAGLLARAGQEARLARQEIRAGRFQRSMAILAAFSAIVSGFEAYVQHRRGAFSHRMMWTPILLTPPMVLASAAAIFSARAARLLLPITSVAALVDGVVGFFLHLRGIQRMPGGFRIGQYNVVMGPPIFAPLLVTLVGILGLLAAFLRREESPRDLRFSIYDLGKTKSTGRGTKSEIFNLKSEIAIGRFQQGMALVSAFLGILAGGEAYFEHLRGSYNQRVMWLPVWVTPPMVVAAIGAAKSRTIARNVLPWTSAVTFFTGTLGFLLHLRGIKRMPGGVHNLEFNVMMGPPVFAPLLFSAVGLLGFIAVLLRRNT